MQITLEGTETRSDLVQAIQNLRDMQRRAKGRLDAQKFDEPIEHLIAAINRLDQPQRDAFEIEFTS